MRSFSTNRAFYTSDEFISFEENALLSNAWIFVGLTDEVPEKGSYKFVSLWNKTYILSNNGTDYRFFINSCPHRGAEIISSSGKGNMKCPYHGWIFNSSGKAFVAGKHHFCDLSSDIELVSFRCQVIGKFVFVTKNCKESLLSYLGEYSDYLISISGMMSNRIDRNVMEIESNWKVVVENTLESYHVTEVHPGSLAPYFAGESQSYFFGMHSHVVEKFTSAFSSSLKQMKKVFFESSEFNDYKHVHIFPNLTIATSGFTNFFIQEFIPKSSGLSGFISHGFLPAFKGSVSSLAAEKFVQSSIEFNRKVFSEDKSVCESVQRGLENMADSEVSFVLSQKEDRLKYFLEKCLALFSAK